jgi:hypothetical protein
MPGQSRTNQELSMRPQTLSTVATAVVHSYSHTALNMINAYRTGGERVLGFVDQQFASAVNMGATRLSDDTRASLINTEKRISGYYAKSLQLSTDRAETVVDTATELVSKGITVIAANADRFDQATKLGALNALNRVAMPAATVLGQVAEKIETGSSQLAKKVAGQPAVVQAVRAQAKAVKKAVVKKAPARKPVKPLQQAAVAKAKTVARKSRAVVKKAAAVI